MSYISYIIIATPYLSAVAGVGRRHWIYIYICFFLIYFSLPTLIKASMTAAAQITAFRRNKRSA